MTVKPPAEAKIGETLSTLEKALLSPLVSGEIRQWLRSVQEATATLSVDLTTFLRTVLHVQYAEIARNAPELSNQLARLTEADGNLLGEVAAFLDQLHRLSEIVDKADPQKTETMLEKHRQHAVEMGLALIMSIRKQQAAAETWYEEAQFRDLGNAAD
jgi:hypothetical protein